MLLGTLIKTAAALNAAASSLTQYWPVSAIRDRGLDRVAYRLWCVLPALLPVASFTPWSGWWLRWMGPTCWCCRGHGRFYHAGAWMHGAALRRRSPERRQAYTGCVVLPLLLLGVWRGLDDARGVTAANQGLRRLRLCPVIRCAWPETWRGGCSDARNLFTRFSPRARRCG